MSDLPDWYTQTQPATMEADSLTHGLDSAKTATPTAGAVYYASDTRILYICAADGTWTGIDAASLTEGILTLYANMVAGGYRITGLGAPTTQDDALRYGRAEIRNAEIAADAAIVYSKLSLALGITNADIALAAAIAYSKLALTGSIVNTDISALAAIAYSKLNLTNSLLTADILSTEFNVASKLLKLDASALVPAAQIPDLFLKYTGGTMSGDITLGAYKLKTTNLFLYETDSSAMAIRNAANTAFRSLYVLNLVFNGALTGSADSLVISAGNTNAYSLLFQARDTAVGLVTIARLVGAADPYLEATLPMLLKPIATASLPGTPVEGMITYDDTINKLVVYNGSAWVAFEPGEGHIILIPAFYNSIEQGTWATGGLDTGYYPTNGAFYNSSSANGDQLTLKAYLAAGTYSMRHYYYKGPDAAIVSLTIDAVEVLSLDCYAAGASKANISTTTGIVIASSGLKAFAIKANGKNASSASYIMQINAIALWRTA